MTQSAFSDAAVQTVERYPALAGLLERVERDRFDDLAGPGGPPVLYRRERRGVRTVAVLASALTPGQIRRLVEYRTAQYSKIGFCDPGRLDSALAEGAPLTAADGGDVHFAALGPDGRLLCAAVLRRLPGVSPEVRMGDADRPLFPVEHVHGRGVFNRLRVLPELPARQVRELSGFVKDASLPALSVLGARGSTEVAAAVFRLPLLEPHGAHIDALIGDLETGVAKVNLDFFGVPAMLLPGTIPQLPDSSFLVPRYETRMVVPFAYLVGDQSNSLERLERVEAALELPDRQCLTELVRLNQDPPTPLPSTLTPATATLAATPLPHQGVPMALRRKLAEQAEALAGHALLAGLTNGEAAVLANYLQQVTAEPGEVVIRRGDRDDALYLVISGELAALDNTAAGELARFGPGDYFGEFAALNEGRRTADVVAATAVRLWRLDAVHYRRYLEQIVGGRVGLAAAGRMSRRLGDEVAGVGAGRPARKTRRRQADEFPGI